MKKYLLPLALLASAIAPQSANAADFFDTSKPETVFDFGVRVGLNTSNSTISDILSIWDSRSWGNGFEAGLVADINVRDYLAIQPGFFYETRNGSWSNFTSKDGYYVATAGKTRVYNFTIPIVASFRFNVTDDIRWNADCGPYLAIKIGTHNSGLAVTSNPTAENPVTAESLGQQRKGAEFGFKIGTGIQVKRHYYVGIHYLAGCTSPWKNYSGHTKQWNFTLGYDF